MKSEDVGWTMAIVFLGIAGNCSYTVAMKWVSPTKANVFRSFEVILNFLLQIFVEHKAFHPTSVIGKSNIWFKISPLDCIHDKAAEFCMFGTGIP